MSAKVSGQAATACAKGSLSGFTHAVSFRAQRSETTGYAAIQSATERPAMHLAGETIADPPLYIKVKADDAPGGFCGALRVLNIKVFTGIVNWLRFAPGGSERHDLGGHQLLLCAVVQLHGVVGQGTEFFSLLPGGKIVLGKYLGAAAGVENGLYHKVAFVHSMPLFSSR